MSLITEVFGPDVVSLQLAEIKILIKNLKFSNEVQKATMLKEFSRIRGIELTVRDFEDFA